MRFSLFVDCVEQGATDRVKPYSETRRLTKVARLTESYVVHLVVLIVWTRLFLAFTWDGSGEEKAKRVRREKTGKGVRR